MNQVAIAAFLLGSLGLTEAALNECDAEHIVLGTSDDTSMLQTHKVGKAPDLEPAPAPCPFDFSPQNCSVAEVQTPRDLMAGAPGDRIPQAATLTLAQTMFQKIANVHFHLGAEHKAEAYQDGKEADAYDAEENPSGPRPGFMCKRALKWKRKPYKFKYCKDFVEVGKSYEIHYVHSSAAYDRRDTDGVDQEFIEDGLGGAANGRGILNPMISVNAQVVQIVHGWWPLHDELKLKWNEWSPNWYTSVMYPGSTTGTGFNNTICSPFAITWHVDKSCYQVTARSFDHFCKQLGEAGLKKDLSAKGSRILVDPAYVVKPEFVVPLA